MYEPQFVDTPELDDGPPIAISMQKAIEAEVGDFIEGFIKCLQPMRVVETGTYPGYSTGRILRALQQNGIDGATLTTFEQDFEFFNDMARHFATDIATQRLDLRVGYCEDFSPYDVAFIDSSPYGQRDWEIKQWLETAGEDTFLILHDVYDRRWQMPEIPVPGVQIPTPWGVGLYQHRVTA